MLRGARTREERRSPHLRGSPMTGAELRAARKRRGMTQAQLAVALDVSISRLHDWETGTERHRGTPAPVPRLVELAVSRLETG